MNMMTRTRFSSVITIACLLGAAPLSGCSPDRPEWMGGEPKRPAADVVVGPKRVPILNPRSQRAPDERPVPPPQDRPMPGPRPTLQDNPYDYFDDSGHVSPQPGASAPSAIERWMGADEAPQAPQAAAGNMRKPFPANPVIETETAVVAPLPPAPQTAAPQAATMAPAAGSEPVAVSMDEPVAPLVQRAPAKEIPAPAPAMAAVQDAPDEVEMPARESDNWADRTHERFIGTQAGKGKDPYPKLSDVPEKPREFERLKATKEQQMQDLELQRAIAEEQRQMLNAEPSQLNPVPVETAPAPAALNEASPPAAPSGEPVLLGHIQSGETVSQYTPPPTAVPAPAPQAAVPADALPASTDTAQPASEAHTQEKEMSAALPPPTMLKTVEVLPPSPYSSLAHRAPQPSQ